MGDSRPLPGTVGDALQWGRSELEPSRTASLDAQLLLGHVLGRPRWWVLAHGDEALDERHEAGFRRLISRRRSGEPVGYIRGFVEWFGMELEVTPHVLIPRPETELLAEQALDLARRRGLTRIADIGTGSGALALAVARSLPESRVWASDRSEAALRIARRNAERLGVGDRIDLLLGDLLAPIAGEPELVVANLPYLSDDMMEELERDVRHEPPASLHGGDTGLELYQRLFRQMDERGWSPDILFEIDPRQARVALDLASRLPAARRVSVYRDYAGLDRMIEVMQGAALAPSVGPDRHE